MMVLAETKPKIIRKFSLARSERIRTRFAPSPTGFLHIGGVRTALFNYLFAKKNKGVFILRIEDTDKERSKPEFEKNILDSLNWLGLEWDEGPYRQSERIDVYRKYLVKLLEENKAYYCFCSPEELETQRQEQASRGVAPKYSGKCSALSKKEVEERLKEKKPCVIRFRVPHKIVEINDLIRGKVAFDTGLLGDIVIAKDLDTPIFHFSNVVDDFEMKISHVIRGEEHLPNTPRHILLQEALGFSTPQYAHIPLILAPDRSKLSKRHGAVSAEEYKKDGYLAEAIINFLAFLGWNPGDEREIYSLAGLIKDFSIEKVQKSAAVFNIKKLDFLNGFYIRQKPIDKLTEMCIPYLIEKNLIKPASETKEEKSNLTEFFGKEFVVVETGEKIGFDRLKRIISLYQERLKRLSEISELTDLFFKKDLQYDKNLLIWKKMGDREVMLVISRLTEVLTKIKDKDFTAEKIEKILLAEAEKTGKEINMPGDRGHLLWPLRAALSGKQYSAGPFDIAEILGKEKTLERLNSAKNIIK